MRIVEELMGYLLNLNPSLIPLHLSVSVGLAGMVAGLVPVEVGAVMVFAEEEAEVGLSVERVAFY
jgi:hypothetical protein